MNRIYLLLYWLRTIMILMSVIGFITITVVSIYTGENHFKGNKKEISAEFVETTKAGVDSNFLFANLPCYPTYNDSTAHDTINYYVEYYLGKVTLKRIHYRDYSERFIYLYDKNSNNTKISYFQDSTLIYTFSQKFNSKNQRIESKTPELSKNSIYKYDKFGHEIEKITKTNAGIVSSIISTKYDLKGLKILYEVNDFNPIKEIYKYDNKSNLKEVKLYCLNNGEYNLKKIKKYQYFGSKNVIESIINIDGTFQIKLFSNNKLKKLLTFENGEKIKTHFNYDTYGNLTEERSNKSIYNWYYNYDEYGNWIRILMFKNGKAETLKERNILYE
jgi:YD repeat-containing protein